MDKPEALLCAEVLEATRDDPMWADHAEITKEACARSAAELRRLHELNVDKTEIIAAISAQRDALLEALREIESATVEGGTINNMARAAIARVEGETNGQA